MAWGGDSRVTADGDDGDGQGSRFWAVRHSLLGEAPFGAPQARKFLAQNAVFLEILVTFEWVSCARQVHDHIRSTPYLARRPLYLAPLVLYLNPTLQGCYQVLKRCELGYFTPCYQLRNPR